MAWVWYATSQPYKSCKICSQGRLNTARALRLLSSLAKRHQILLLSKQRSRKHSTRSNQSNVGLQADHQAAPSVAQQGKREMNRRQGKN